MLSIIIFRQHWNDWEFLITQNFFVREDRIQGQKLKIALQNLEKVKAWSINSF